MEKLLVSSRLAQLRVRHMTLLDLIANGGSLSKAAKILCVTQPAVTAMLRELELVLGEKLVDRDRQGARLTAIGTDLPRDFRTGVNLRR
jgi:molybdate transport repressor ModE-like protein